MNKQQHKMVKIHVETAQRLDKIRFGKSWCKKMSYNDTIHILLDEHEHYAVLSSLASIMNDAKMGGDHYKRSLQTLNDKVNQS